MEDYGFSISEDSSDSFDTHSGVASDFGNQGSFKILDYVPSEKIQKANQNIQYGYRKSSGDFINVALGILYNLTPAILILDSHRRVIFANREAEGLLESGDVISQDSKGYIYCSNNIAQSFLLQYLQSHKTADKSLFNDEDGTFLIPKAGGWPLVAMLGCDQLDSLPFSDAGAGDDKYVTLMIRDPNGRNPEQSKKLMEYFGLSGAESSVVGELVNGCSTDEIARKRGVSVITIRNQLKSAQNKMGVARQSELVSLVLRYVS